MAGKNNEKGVDSGVVNGGPKGPTQQQKPIGVPTIPDTDGGAGVPKPIDLSLLAAPTTPARRALRDTALGGSFPAEAGITGYAGVFVP